MTTHEFRFRIPKVLLEKTDLVYNPNTGLDVDTHEEGKIKAYLVTIAPKTKFFFSTWLGIEEETALAHPSVVQAQNQTLDANIRCLDRSESNQGTHPQQAGYTDSYWLHRLPILREIWLVANTTVLSNKKLIFLYKGNVYVDPKTQINMLNLF